MEPGGFDMQRIFQAAQQVMSAQQALADSEVTGTAGGGAVRAVVSGAGELRNLTISPSVIDTADPAETAATVADLVLAAIRDASRAVAEMQQQQLGALGGGVPGLDLSALGMPGAVPGQAEDFADEDDDYDDEDDDYDDEDDDLEDEDDDPGHKKG